MTDTRIDSPKLKLPESKDSLFVTKPIADYEPITADEEVLLAAN
jgi:hypothetical protein